MSTVPYVSFVTYGRNDGYTPSYARRVSRATSCLAAQLERAKIDSEIILSEWNPVQDRPLLLDTLTVPKTLRHVAICGIVVGRQYHGRLAGSQERGIHVGEAANVGIRRARGQFTTPKASDTLFSQGVIDMIARRDLDPNTMYRIDRHDVSIDDNSIWDLEDDALLSILESMRSSPHSLIQQSRHWGLRDLHTNACGDFTLMHSSLWQLLRGHARDDTVLSLDLDSLLMHAAAAHGVCERRWPASCRVFKPLHGNLNNVRINQVWQPWQRALDKFLSEKIGEAAALWARTSLDYPRREVRGVTSIIGPSIERNFVRPARSWARGHAPAPTQPSNWGLADEPLVLRNLCRADWESENGNVVHETPVADLVEPRSVA